MPELSTESPTPRSRIHLFVIIGFFSLVGGLLAYLFTAALPAGDAAAYLDQVLAGRLDERTVHLGYLFQLRLLAAWLGDAAGAALSACWGMIALLALWRTSTALGERPRTALVAPGFLVTTIPFWTHSLFAEVYGPSAAALAVAVLLRLRGRPVAAGLVAALAASIHPGALVWVPTLALMGNRRPRFVAAAILPVVVIAACVADDYLLGGRGVLSTLSLPQPWHAAQRAWRTLVWGAPLTAALCLIGLFDGRARRRVMMPLLPGIALSMLTDWYTDVPAMLPALYLLALLAPAGARRIVRYGSSAPRIAAIGVLLVMVLQLGEATSVHDRARRDTEREVDAIRALDVPGAPQPWGSFGERARYRHYVQDSTGPMVVSLPPGRPFPAGACPRQRAATVAPMELFLCPQQPFDP